MLLDNLPGFPDYHTPLPNGLADKLSTEELAAILAYLESLPAK